MHDVSFPSSRNGLTFVSKLIMLDCERLNEKDGSSIHVSKNLCRRQCVRQSRKLIFPVRVDTSKRYSFLFPNVAVFLIR